MMRRCNTLHQALQIDNLREDIHRLMMACYAAKGEPAQIIRQFHDLQQLLSDELDTIPSMETRALVDRLLVRPTG